MYIQEHTHQFKNIQKHSNWFKYIQEHSRVLKTIKFNIIQDNLGIRTNPDYGTVNTMTEVKVLTQKTS